MEQEGATGFSECECEVDRSDIISCNGRRIRIDVRGIIRFENLFFHLVNGCLLLGTAVGL